MFGGFHMGGGWFWLILILVMLVIGFIAFQTYSRNTRFSQGDEKSKGQSKTAREIADERYANGEISRDEYLQIVEDIESRHAPG